MSWISGIPAEDLAIIAGRMGIELEDLLNGSDEIQMTAAAEFDALESERLGTETDRDYLEWAQDQIQ